MQEKKQNQTNLKRKERVTDTYDDKVEIVNGKYGHWIYKNSEYIFQPMGLAVYLDKITENLTTREQLLQLRFTDTSGKEKHYTLPRKNLTETGIMDLLAVGVQVQKKTAQFLIASILNQEYSVECEHIHDKLGFIGYENQRLFLGKNAIGIQSSYSEDLMINPTGDFNKWKDMIVSEVQGRTAMEFILAAACTAPLIDFLEEEIHTGNILILMVGESSTGKTSAGYLAVSTGAKSTFQENTMVATFGDTANSLMHIMHSSYPMLLDEGSLIKSNPTAILYSMAQGKERGRLTKELKKAESNTFSTVIFMTSEKSILKLCDQNTGLRVRCLEFEGVTWTKSAESSDIIKSVCEQNYAHMIPKIAKYLLDEEKSGGRKAIIKRYEEFRKEVVAGIKEAGRENGFTERISKPIALILLSAEIASEIIGVSLDTEGICEFIKKYTGILEEETYDIGKRAIDYLCQYISQHRAEFITIRKNDEEPRKREALDLTIKNCRGVVKEINSIHMKHGMVCNQEVCIGQDIFRQILEEADFLNEKLILAQWKKEGYLNTQKDRYISKIKVQKTEIKGYRIYLPVSADEGERKDGK